MVLSYRGTWHGGVREIHHSGDALTQTPRGAVFFYYYLIYIPPGELADIFWVKFKKCRIFCGNCVCVVTSAKKKNVLVCFVFEGDEMQEVPCPWV